MHTSSVDAIANAVLYEGYILYPYRRALKNRQRWTFGGLFPRDDQQATSGSEPWFLHSECLVRGSEQTRLRVRVRFLHAMERTAGALPVPLARWPSQGDPEFYPVETLHVGDRQYPSWQEATEREVIVGGTSLGSDSPILTERLPHPGTHGTNEPGDEPADGTAIDGLLAERHRVTFSFPARRELEPVYRTDDAIVGVLVRQQERIAGTVELAAEKIQHQLFKISLRIMNDTPSSDRLKADRDMALRHSLISTHAIMSVADGQFVSMIDPDDQCRGFAGQCKNVGAWPVLVGEEGQRDTILLSPIILYDYPEVAPESPGDFFDGTEIDEMLTLRIMTLTDTEKQEMAAVDPRAFDMLQRTQAMAHEELLNLHGTFRHVRPAERGDRHA